jgi:two-component system phosphate regulon sensor histidine kinase PhoR
MTAPRIVTVVATAVAALLAGAAALTLTASAGVGLVVASLGAAGGVLLLSGSRAAPPRPVVAEAAHAAALDAELHQLLDPIPVGLLLIAPDATIRFANRHATEFFGLPGSPGLPVGTLRARRLLDLVDDALRQRRSGTAEFWLTRAGDAYLRAHVRPLGGNPGGAVLAIEDRTEAQRSGEMHRDFVANASHELKTPLAAVAGIVDTLLGHARDDPAATERFLGILATQTERMRRLVEDLLSLNRIEINERIMPDEPQELGAIVAEAVDMLRPAANEAQVRLEFTPLEERAHVLGDRNELGQLFRNLIENAIRYGGAGVDVRVSAVPPPPQHAALIGIAVRDTGPGIAREHLPRLTERFYRVSVRSSREKGGTGLGLAIVKHILNRHRGRLEIESRLGEGSCFTAWLPLVGQPSPSAALADGAGARPEGVERAVASSPSSP